MKNKSVPVLSLVFEFLIAVIFSVVQVAWAGGSEAKAASDTRTAEVPYKLIEGKQYEICKALLPFINTMPHGTLRDQPELLEKLKYFKLPDWKQVKDKKYIDLLIKYEKQYFPDQYSNDKYDNNFSDISRTLESGSLKMYTVTVDIDNSGNRRPVLRTETWIDGKRSDNYTYFPYKENSMELDRQYLREINGEIISYQGRTFRFAEWPVGGDFNRWKIEIDEPYYSENRAPEFGPATRPICIFFPK